MKPKRRIMCPDCKRQKMLFETREQALNFIKFNGDEIDTHGGVLRPYYCPACCGYHITSKEYNEKYEGRTDRLINAYKRDKEILDEHDKYKLDYERRTRFVNKVYKQYMSDKKYGCISCFMADRYPTLSQTEVTAISKRLKHRQMLESLDWWRSMPKEERSSITDKIAILAVKLNFDEMCVLDDWLKREYKTIPEGCGSSIKNKCLIIRDEMG